MAVSLKNKLKTLITLDFRLLSALLSQKFSGYLIDEGWFNSFKTKSSIDKNFKPIPWMTYPFLDFIAGRLNDELSVFEFGSGNSTLFFAEKVKCVKAVEHNSDWINYLRDKLPKNAELIYQNIENKLYSESCYITGLKYDIIIIDGEERVSCISDSINSLSENGVIILDDSERNEYKDGVDYLKAEKFKQIDFWGISPGILFKKCTTIFYKNNNCLDI